MNSRKILHEIVPVIRRLFSVSPFYWIILLCLSFQVSAQENAISAGNVNSCGGFLVDSGLSAADYGNNENFTSTICATAPQTIVNLYWTVCVLGNGDYIEIFDGNSTGATLLGVYFNNELQSLNITSTNPSGCLTVHFVSDANMQGNFAAEISCGLPCIRPISQITSDQEPIPLMVCPGELITFNGSNTQFFNSANLGSFQWVFDDGTTDDASWPNVSHAFNQPGGYKVQLSITDSNGCTNTNLNDYIVFVSTPPEFDLITDITSLCSGGEAFLGVTNFAQDSLFAGDSLNNWLSVPWIDFPDNENSEGYHLMDDQSQCFDVYFTYNGFAQGEIIDNVSDIMNAYINFEHSFMQDLVISVICPNGQSVILHQQAGGGADLGIPVAGTTGEAGTGYDYYWLPTATNGTWATNVVGTGLPSGTYESLQPFTNLIGCPLNGTWTFEFCDMWIGDDGFLFNYGMNFNPSLYGEVLNFSPHYGAGCDSTFWSGPGITTATSGCDYINVVMEQPGTYSYTYTAINNFGCSYDTTLNISVTVAPQVTAGPDLIFDCNNPNIVLQGGFSNQTSPDFVWSWSPAQYLGNSTSSVTPVSGLMETQVFTLTGYPSGQPNCFSADEMTVTVNSDFSIQVSNLHQVCAGDSAHLEAPEISGGTAPFQYSWITPEGNIISQPSIDIPVAFSQQYCAFVTDACGATDSACTMVNVFDQIAASFVVDEPFGCDPHYVSLSSDYTTFQNITSMKWYYDDGTTGSAIASTNHLYSIPGWYYPWLEITDHYGCKHRDTLENPVVVWPTPHAQFTVDEDLAILPNTSFRFTNTTITGEDYLWTFDQFGETNANDTTWTFPAETEGNYLIGLVAYNQFGCRDSVYRYVRVDEEIDLYIPNAFTPDNDGINDVWQLKGKGFQRNAFKVEIFNRWGEILYQSDDPDFGWTGNYANGDQYIPDGIYFYRVTIRDTRNDVNHRYEGHITLVR